MKTQYSILALSLCLSASTFAATATPLAAEKGYSGEISLQTGFASVRSNLNTYGDASISDLNQSASSHSDSLILPLGNITYTFDDLNRQVYAGMNRSDIAVGNLVMEVGARQKLASGTVLDVSFIPGFITKDVWADPFKTGANRDKTDARTTALRFKVDNIGGTSISLDSAYSFNNVDNDKAGASRGLSRQQQDLLRRDSTAFFIKADFRQPLSATSFLKPAFSMTTAEADGSANSYIAYGAEVTYFKVLDRNLLALTASYSNRDYEAVNPVFNKARTDNEFGLFAAYEHKHFMGWQNWSFISLAGLGMSESNIDFYDSKQYMMSVGMNYQFQ